MDTAENMVAQEFPQIFNSSATLKTLAHAINNKAATETRYIHTSVKNTKSIDNMKGRQYNPCDTEAILDR